MGLAEFERDFGAAPPSRPGGLAAFEADFGPGNAPVPGAPVPIGQRASQTLGRGYEAIAKILHSIDTVGGRLPGTPEGSFITPESANPVPQNLTQAFSQFGQLLLPGSAGPVARILTQAGLGEIGSRLEGNEPWTGAVRAGAPAALGEVIGGGLNFLGQSGPGARGFIADTDAANYGREINRQTRGVVPTPRQASLVNPRGPSLLNPTSPRQPSPSEELQGIAGGPAQDLLGAQKERAVQTIERMLPGGAKISVPALNPKEPIPLRDAADQLSAIGARAFSKNPIDRTYNGIDQRRLWGQVSREISAGLGAQNPQAVPLWETAQDIYKTGLALVKPLQSNRAFTIGPGGPADTQFNTPAMQQYMQNTRPRAEMRNKLGPDDYQSALDVITRGAGGGRDILGSGRGHMSDALREVIRNKGQGFWSIPMALLRAPLPNTASQYVGETPFAAPPSLRAFFDLVLQRKADQLTGGAP